MKRQQLAQCTTFIGMLLLNVFLGAGCGEKVQKLPGAGPVEHFEKRAHWIYVYPKQGVANKTLYTTSLLAPFTPGHPLDIAISLYGTPKTEVPEKHGARYLIYETKNGIIKLGSESTADDFTSYPMYFVPNDRKPAAFFCTEIVEQIDASAAKQVVMLFDVGYTTPSLLAQIEYGQIQEVVLSDPAGAVK